MLRVAEGQSVRDVEIDADVLAAELVYKGSHFERADEEFIPDIFDRDGHAGFLSCGKRGLDKLGRALIGQIVAHGFRAGNEVHADCAGNGKDRVDSELLRALDLARQECRGLCPHRWIRTRGVGTPIEE